MLATASSCVPVLNLKNYCMMLSNIPCRLSKLIRLQIICKAAKQLKEKHDSGKVYLASVIPESIMVDSETLWRSQVEVYFKEEISSPYIYLPEEIPSELKGNLIYPTVLSHFGIVSPFCNVYALCMTMGELCLSDFNREALSQVDINKCCEYVLEYTRKTMQQHLESIKESSDRWSEFKDEFLSALTTDYGIEQKEELLEMINRYAEDLTPATVMRLKIEIEKLHADQQLLDLIFDLIARDKECFRGVQEKLSKGEDIFVSDVERLGNFSATELLKKLESIFNELKQAIKTPVEESNRQILDCGRSAGIIPPELKESTSPVQAPLQKKRRPKRGRSEEDDQQLKRDLGIRRSLRTKHLPPEGDGDIIDLTGRRVRSRRSSDHR